jgi:hypothetical protein
MFSKLKTMAAATAVAGLVGLAGAGNAHAVKVGTIGTPIGSGSMAITATAPSSRLVVHGPTGSIPINCTNTSATGSINTGAFGTSYPITIGTIQPIFNNGGTPPADCIGPSGFLFAVSCVNTSQLQVTGPVAGGVTPGRIAGIDCTISFTALGCTARATGTVNGRYQNPALPSTPGRLTVLAANQALNVVSGCPQNIFPSGPATFGGTGGTPTTVTDLVYTLGGGASANPFISL